MKKFRCKIPKIKVINKLAQRMQAKLNALMEQAKKDQQAKLNESLAAKVNPQELKAETHKRSPRITIKQFE